MASLLTLEQAKMHLKIPLSLTDDDTEVALKSSQATDAILNWLKGRADPAWTSDSVPGDVQHAVQIYLTHIYENRGNDMKADEDVWKAIDRVAGRWRDPALA